MAAAQIAVVDYGMGNLRSVAQALIQVAGTKRVAVTADAAEIAAAERIVFPGQGAMPDCMAELSARGLKEAVLAAARAKPFLGICIGLQCLFARSEEGDTPGLGVFAGDVRRFPETRMRLPDGTRLKVPHMGWNRVAQTPHPLWRDIEDGARFYFVHSYYALPEETALTLGATDYGLSFTSAAGRTNIFAVQFHPEKSARDGLRLLKNFVDWRP
ncbi:MAG: imidazole glycerol phosphate synthase subunit HisH [Zoogloeaceae bacterium]|jgi:glutamine amidotransferase|nr:imidazole glycerol phosphate synthase subunit HisH [Zoogloeaceae bacterium]